jgi:hypothetical protein
MSGIIGVSPDMRSGMVGKSPSGMIRQIKISPNMTQGSTTGNISLTTIYFDTNIISGNRVILHATVTIDKRTSAIGNSGDINIVGTDLSVTVCSNIGDGISNQYTILTPAGSATVIPTSSTNPGYYISFGNSNNADVEITQSRLTMYEVWV